MGRWGRSARIALVSLVLAAGLFVFVFPTRSLLAQRGDIDQARRDLKVLREENARLEREAALLQTSAEVERIARERYHMVRPGEEAFAVVPAPATAPTRTPAAPTTPTTTPASTAAPGP